MKKMKTSVVLSLLFVVSNVVAQKIEILNRKDTTRYESQNRFDYLFPATDLSTASEIAVLKITGNSKKIVSLFGSIMAQSRLIGGNAYRFNSSTRLPDGNLSFSLTVFHASDSLLVENDKNYPKNTVYIFGNENFLDASDESFKINGKKNVIGAGTYKVFELTEGQELKINKGGFMGVTVWISCRPDKDATFLNFSGLGVNGVNFQPGMNGVGVNISTGKIERVDDYLAFTLLHLFERRD